MLSRITLLHFDDVFKNGYLKIASAMANAINQWLVALALVNSIGW